MNIPTNYSMRQDVLFTNSSTTYHPHHHQISPTIFVCVSNHNTTSDNQSHSNREIIDISDDDEEEDENTCKNGTSIDDSSDEEEIEVIQLSDENEVNDESSGEIKTKVKEDQTGRSVFRSQVLKTIGLTCRECSVLIETRSKLEQHMMKMHDKLLFKCMVRGCNRQFTKRSLLNKHYEHHKKNQAKLLCSTVDCQFKTSNQPSLVNHVYLYHEKDLFQCAQCLQTYAHRFMVHKHFTAVHKRPNKHFRCPFKACHFMGKQKFSLETHLITHTKLKPFLCTWRACGYSAKKHSNVIQHIRTRHFHLPETVKEAVQRNIQCDQDPHQFVSLIPYDLDEALSQELDKPENV